MLPKQAISLNDRKKILIKRELEFILLRQNRYKSTITVRNIFVVEPRFVPAVNKIFFARIAV